MRLGTTLVLDWSPSHLGYVVVGGEQNKALAFGSFNAKQSSCTSFYTINEVQRGYIEGFYTVYAMLENLHRTKLQLCKIVMEGAAMHASSRYMVKYHQSCGAFASKVCEWSPTVVIDDSRTPSAIKRFWTGRGVADKEEMYKALVAKAKDKGYVSSLLDSKNVLRYDRGGRSTVLDIITPGTLREYLATISTEKHYGLDVEGDITDALALAHLEFPAHTTNDAFLESLG